MKIAEYNDMMSYLTRQNFNSGTKKPTTISDLIKSKDIVKGDEYKPKNPKLIQSIRAFEEKYGFRKKESDGGPQIIPPSKPAEDPLEVFKKQADLFLQGSFGSSDKTFFNNLIEQEYDKAIDAGVLPEEAISFLKERSEMYRKLAEEGRMQGEPATLGPSYGREDKAIGGGAFVGEQLPNNREGFKLVADPDSIKGPLTRGDKREQYSVRVRDSKTKKRFTKYFKDETKFKNFLETNAAEKPITSEELRAISKKLKKKLGTIPTPTQIAEEAGSTIPTVKRKTTEGKDYVQLSQSERSKLGGQSAGKIRQEGLLEPDDTKGIAKLQKKVDALNEKYKLADKSVKFNLYKTKSGFVGPRIEYGAAIYKDTLGKSTDTASLEELEKIMKKFSKTKLFKNYSKAEQFSIGGIKSAIKQLRNQGSKQDLIFNYILNTDQVPTVKELSKKFNMNEDLIKKDIKKLYTNIYRRRAGEGAPYLPDSEKKLLNVINKVTKMDDVNLVKDSVLNLITDAYGDSEQGDALRAKVRKFYTLQNKIPKKYQKFFISQLDHIIPLNFLNQVKSGLDPEDLIRINPLPGFLNQRGFKSQLDNAIGIAKRTSDTKEGKEALKAYSELQTFLPEVLGGISKTGKIKDFGAETLTEGKSLSQAQLKQTKKIYDSVLKFIDNPKVKPLLEKLGINQQTAFDALRGSGQLIKKNIPGFLNTFKRILERNPDLRVELGDDLSEIENQFAQLDTGTMTDVYTGPKIPKKEQEQDPLPYEAALPAAGVLGRYGPQILNFTKNVGKGLIKPVISPLGAGTFSAMELMSDDPSEALAGLELLYPEVIRKVKGKISPIKGFYDKALALSPNLKYAPYVTRGMSGIGTLMIGADAYQGLKNMAEYAKKRGPLTEQELLDMREKETYMGGIADAFDKAYREGTPLPGRTGFADGPEDPSKRTFMKILGGIMSLPILGRFFTIGEKARPIAEKLFTEVQQLKNTTTEMPEWFPTFLNKFRKEGKAENVFKQEKVEVTKAEYDKALAEGKGENYYTDVARTPEYKANNPDHMDYFKLEDTDELIYTKYTNEKFPGVQVDDMDGNIDVMFENYYSQPVSINYTAPGKRGPETGRADLFVQGEAKMETKPKGEFVANDVETYATDPDGGYDTEDIIADSLDDMMEGTTRQMEEYATGKKVKGISRGEDRVVEREIRAEQAAEAAAEEADDFD